jgi:hypothetical protein
MSTLVDRCFLDGDVTIAKQNGAIYTEQPFDFQPQTQIFYVPMRQMARYYAPVAINSLMPGDPNDVAAISGNFVAKFKGQATIGIAAGGDQHTAFQSALQALSTLGAGRATVTGNWNDGYSVGFNPQPGDNLEAGKNLLVLNMNGVSPGYKAQVILTHTSPATQSVRFTPINSSANASRYLIQETRRSTRGRMIYWDRVYANIPLSWGEFVPTNYQEQKYQVFRIPWSGQIDLTGSFQGTYRTFIDIAEYSEPLVATAFYSYCLGKDVGKKEPLRLPFRIIHGRDTFGNEFVYFVGQPGVAQPTGARRWKGDIWEVKNEFVNPY